MAFLYRVAANHNEIEEFSKIALKAHLYHSGPNWMLKNYLKDDMVRKMVIAYSGVIRKKPVGVAIVSRHSIVMTYVHEEYRLKGIGTKMLLKIGMPKYPVLLEGIMGSKVFYKKAMEKYLKDATEK